MLQLNDRKEYDTYRCNEHGIYQIRKDVPVENHYCLYCKKQHSKLSEDDIQKLLL